MSALPPKADIRNLWRLCNVAAIRRALAAERRPASSLKQASACPLWFRVPYAAYLLTGQSAMSQQSLGD